MIKLITSNEDGNVMVGVRPIFTPEEKPTKYTAFAHYSGTRGDREVIDGSLRSLWQEGELDNNGTIDPTSEAKLIFDIINRVKELERQKNFGLVVNEIDTNRNGETASILEREFNIRMTDEGLITNETKKGLLTTLDSMRNT